MSQLELALAANISQRHISFLETGRANPSQTSILGISGALDLPAFERDAMLSAAGFKVAGAEQALAEESRNAIAASMDHVLHCHNPYPAVVVDAIWNLQQANDAALAFFAHLGVAGETNLLRSLLLPGPVKDALINWPDVARAMMRLFESEALRRPHDQHAQSLLRSLSQDPQIGSVLALPFSGAVAPVLTLEIQLGEQRLRLFTLIATIGMSHEVRFDDARLETLLPADESTRDWFDRLAG